MKDKVLIHEIEKYLTFLKKMSQEDFNSILKKEKEIIFEIKNKQGFIKSKESLVSDGEIENIIVKLGSLEARDVGLKYLEELDLGRADIELILRKLDMPFLKKDSILKLNDKIIEGTIGFKLRSQAIQNKP